MSSYELSSTWRTASARGRGHRCATCGGHIPPGQRYHDGRYVTDDRPWTCREHAFCHEVYWVIHRYLGLYDDEVVEWDSVREVMAGLVCFMVRPTS